MARTKSNMPTKTKHRGHNEGSVYQRTNGDWVAQLQVGFKPNGSRKFITKISKDRKVVSEWLIENQNSILKNTFIEPSSITLEQWIWNWLTTYKLKSVKSNTYARYLSLMNNHIVPEIKNLKLKDLRSIHIQKIYNKLSENGMAYATLKHVHTVFNQALDCAVRENLISKNFSIYTVRPKQGSPQEVAVFTLQEQEKIIKNLPFSPLGVLIRTGIGTGARFGELLGLQWSDIDFKENTIHIRHGLVKHKVFSEDGKKILKHQLKLGDLKTKKSKRDIPITDDMISLLRKYKLNQRAFIKNDDVIPDMVFLSESGTYWDESNARKLYKKYLEKIGVPYIKFHALRHTFATRVMEANVHPKIAQELLGHSTMSITMDIYSHVLPEQKKEAINKIKNII